MSEKTLPETYHGMIKIAIDEKGVYPHQAIGLGHDGKMLVMALAFGHPSQALMQIAKTIREDKPKEVIWSLDRMCKDGQGTTLGDCVAGYHWDGTNFKPFIIEYQHDPRIVKEIQWDNEFWNGALAADLEFVQSLL